MAKWEMVVPKMERPTPKAALAAAPKPALPDASESPPAEAPQAAELYLNTLFGSQERGLWSLFWLQWNRVFNLAAVFGLTILVVVPAVWWMSGKSSAPVPPPASVQTPGWERVPLVGSRLGKQVLLFHVPKAASDYRIEFDWTPDSKGVGWVYRASDPRNYNAVRVSLSRAGTAPVLIVERSSVLAAAESERSRVPVPWTKDDSTLRVRIRMDALGPAVSLYVQGKLVDHWTERRLAAGDLGFFEDQNHEPSVGSVQVSFFGDAKKGYRGSFQDLVKSLP
jgi:hypothetical protein